MDADDLNEKGLVPGEPILYRRGSQLPKILEEPPLSEMASAQCRQLAEDMEYVAGVSGLMASGTLPGGEYPQRNTELGQVASAPLPVGAAGAGPGDR